MSSITLVRIYDITNEKLRPMDEKSRVDVAGGGEEEAAAADERAVAVRRQLRAGCAHAARRRRAHRAHRARDAARRRRETDIYLSTGENNFIVSRNNNFVLQ